MIFFLTTTGGQPLGQGIGHKGAAAHPPATPMAPPMRGSYRLYTTNLTTRSYTVRELSGTVRDLVEPIDGVPARQQNCGCPATGV